MNTTWKHVRTVIDGERCEVNGQNIWDHAWQQTGEQTLVVDPLYGQKHRMTIYAIRVQSQLIRFAAGEFSQGVWGIYREC